MAATAFSTGLNTGKPLRGGRINGRRAHKRKKLMSDQKRKKKVQAKSTKNRLQRDPQLYRWAVIVALRKEKENIISSIKREGFYGKNIRAS